MLNNIAVIQARIGSSRLPSKMLLRLGPHSILDWVLKRTLTSKKIDKVILATSTSDEDKALAKVASEYNIETFFGSEDDVLSRFYKATKDLNPTNIIRICADNPLIDGDELDRLINFFEIHSYDYAFNNTYLMDNEYADGFGAEILSFKTLESLYSLSKSNQHREHVTKYIIDNKNSFNIGILKAPSYLSYPEYSFDVDTIEDLHYLEFLVEKGLHINLSAKEIMNLAKRNSYNGQELNS